ncbi:undecaprenyl/decaprenyl-phosphate alpha-N-acetylglucosaminyl 1-phosphate transferase [Candidatus Dependentiae bacterium]|nr:undecaprenyl/decaprenyl-phosphate alpha-N-acetylglucosaminyl 1-phosphate transferase [Candidatus Dependentiae bacterium]
MTLDINLLIKLAVISFISSIILIPILRLIALKFKIVDKPDNDLKTHTKPIPYLGGLAIFLAVGIGFVYYFIKYQTFNSTWNGLIFASLIILLTGLIDDVKKIKWYVKLFGQIVAAITVISFGIHLKIMFYPTWLNIIITFIWIIMITNSINIIDIMDGLATSISIIAFIAFLAIAFPQDNLFVVIISVLFIFSAIPFFFWNMPKAKVFLGDTGALLLGFILAIVSIQVSYTTVNTIAMLVPVIILGIPIFDVSLVSLIRISKKIPIVKGSPDHLALRLKKIGLPDAKTLLLIDWLAMFLAISSVAITFTNTEVAIVIYLFIFFSALVFGFELSKIDMKKEIIGSNLE